MRLTTVMAMVGAAVASNRAEQQRVVAPAGAFSMSRLLNPFSGHLPSPPPPAFPLPNVVPLWRVRPRLRLTKQLGRGSVSCIYAVDGKTQVNARIREPLLDGHVELDSQTARLTWSKLWLFPGLTDAATRVELRSVLDLRGWRTESELRLRLRGVQREGANQLRLVHRVRVSQRASLDAGASLTLPDELRIGTDGKHSLAAQVEILVDQLDLCVDL